MNVFYKVRNVCVFLSTSFRNAWLYVTAETMIPIQNIFDVTELQASSLFMVIIANLWENKKRPQAKELDPEIGICENATHWRFIWEINVHK